MGSTVTLEVTFRGKTRTAMASSRQPRLPNASSNACCRASGPCNWACGWSQRDSNLDNKLDPVELQALSAGEIWAQLDVAGDQPIEIAGPVRQALHGAA